MLVEPLPRQLYDQLRNTGVVKVELAFEGGSDEGMLRVHLQYTDGECASKEVRSAVESWAWEVYSYSGAGDGNAYGDNILYDFETGKVTVQTWCMERVESEPIEKEVEIFQEGN